MTEITVRENDIEVKVRIDASDARTVLDSFIGAMVSLGYSPLTIQKTMSDVVKETDNW